MTGERCSQSFKTGFIQRPTFSNFARFLDFFRHLFPKAIDEKIQAQNLVPDLLSVETYQILDAVW